MFERSCETLSFVRYMITCTIINTFDSIKYFGLLYNNFNIMDQ